MRNIFISFFALCALGYGAYQLVGYAVASSQPFSDYNYSIVPLDDKDIDYFVRVARRVIPPITEATDITAFHLKGKGKIQDMPEAERQQIERAFERYEAALASFSDIEQTYFKYIAFSVVASYRFELGSPNRAMRLSDKKVESLIAKILDINTLGRFLPFVDGSRSASTSALKRSNDFLIDKNRGKLSAGFGGVETLLVLLLR